MVTREQLRTQGLRAYEVGRLVAAARVGVVLLPVVALCLLEPRAREVCACLALVLVGLAVWLRWRNRQGVESVATGLIAGSIPLAVGLLLEQFGLRCSYAGDASFCVGFGLLAGGGAGAYIGRRQCRWRLRAQSVVAAVAVAALAASLGCVRLGAIGLASVVVGIGLGTVITTIFSRRA